MTADAPAPGDQSVEADVPDHAPPPAIELTAPLEVVEPIVPEFDLLDELTPPFMRHSAESSAPAPHALADDERSLGGSALDVDALRALVGRREDGAAAGEGERVAGEPAPGSAAPSADVDAILDERQIEAAFEDAAVDLPLLEVDGIVPPEEALDVPGGLEVTPFSVDDLLGEAPSFGAESNVSFTPAPLFGEGAGDEAVTDSRNDDAEASPPAREEGEAAAGDADSTGAAATPVPGLQPPVGDSGEVRAVTDEWPTDAAPEVLIDGEWRDEHMGDLVSGEVRAVTSFDPDGPRRTPRFDDLSAALMWPAEDGDGGTPAGVGGGDGAAAPGAQEWVRRGVHAHTPHSTLSFGGVEAQLRRRLELDPANLALRQQLGEALLDQGAREEGLAELDAVMRGYEATGNLEAARGVADVVLRVVPTSVRHHQKRVEYAVRSNDRVRLVEAYVELADSLFRSGEPDKARVVYARVLELAPGNGRARFALGLLEAEEGPAGPTAPEGAGEPSARASMSSLFDPTVARPTPFRGVTPPFVTLPLIDAGLEDDASGTSSTRDAAEVDVHDLVAGERLDAAQREQDERDASVDASLDASRDVPLEAGEGGEATDALVAPFPPPSLDESIDAAFATPPVVEIAPVGVESDVLPSADADDFSGTPPLGAAALVTPFAGDDAPAVIDDGYLLPEPAAPAGEGDIGESPASVELEEAAAPVPTLADRTDATPAGVGAVEEDARDLAPTRAPAPTPPEVPAAADDDFVDLGSWLREDEPVRSTRMVTEDAPPTGDEQADFDEMLRRFKQGVAANVDEEDYASHYDLGVAYKEMGLVDEAIAEFQKSLRGDTHRVRSYEALGQCFVEKGQHQVAVTLLRRAAESTGADDQQLVGVLYLLGYASEVLARHADALGYYQRVFAVDIEFRDVAQRVAAMEHKTQ